MKHGPIALVDEHLPVVFVAPKDEVYQKVLSNLAEVHARGGDITAVTTEGDDELGALVQHRLAVPATTSLLSPVLTVIPLQLLAYQDRKSTRLNSSHLVISYAVFCLKKK